MLITALEKILHWFEKNNPIFANSFSPPLNSQEIEGLLSGIPFYLPEELYDLYQWRNGTTGILDSMVFPSGDFLPLEQAIEMYYGLLEALGDQALCLYKDKPLFPFCECNGYYCAVILEQSQQDTSPVIMINDVYDTWLEYPSLTIMMQNLAESFEIGAYFVDEEGFIDCNPKLVSQVLRKYSPDLIEEALTSASSILSVPLDLLSEDMIESLHSQLAKLRQLNDHGAINTLLNFIKTYPSAINESSKDFVRVDVVHTIAEIASNEAFDTVSSLLKDQVDSVRYYAARALGNIGDKKAIPILFESLADNDTNVRREVCRSLITLNAFNIISPAAKHSNPLVRLESINMIDNIRPSESIGLLLLLLEDEDLEVRRHAQIVLKHFQ